VSSRRATAPRSVVFLLATSLALLGTAAILYPGGSWADAQRPGFDLANNYWSDLVRAEALNGMSNAVGRLVAQAGLAAMAAALLVFFRLATRLVSGGAARRLTQSAGVASALCVLLMALLPHAGFRRAHTVLTLAGGGSGLLAALVVVLHGARDGGTMRRIFDALLVLSASSNLALYAVLVLSGGGDSAALPVIQKAATLVLVLWMVVTSYAAARKDGS
jgi:hypothetical protein